MINKTETNKARVFLIKIDKIVGYLYVPKGKSQSAIIYLKGGPSLGDDGNSNVWQIVRKNKQILFIPDYIGYCHSFGKFSFENCVKTIYEAEKFLRGATSGTDTKTGQSIKLNCSNISLVGSSWGGAIAPFLEKYQKTKIKNIALIKPITNWKTLGKTKFKEENPVVTDQVIKEGWENIYRGYSQSQWPEIFQGKLSEYNPIDNVNLLKNKNVYIYHGKKDQIVNWRKSLKYYQTFKKIFPQANVNLKLIKGADHSSQTNIDSMKMFLNILKKDQL